MKRLNKTTLKLPFFIQITALVIAVMILSLALTILIYTSSAERIFSGYQVDRLKEEVSIISSMIPQNWSETDNLNEFFNTVFQAESTMLSSYIVVSDKQNVEIYSYVPKNPKAGIELDKSTMDNFYRKELFTFYRRALAGQHINTIITSTQFDSEIIVLMRPIFEKNGMVQAVLTICKFREDINLDFKNINLVLIVTMLIVGLLLSYPAYLLVKSTMKPLEDIRKIAVSMGEGDFSVRINEQYPGELQQFADTMNHLASQLDITIKELLKERNILHGVLQSMKEGILVLDGNEQPVLTNPMLHTLFNSKKDYSSKIDLIPLDSIWEDFGKSFNNSTTINSIHNYGGIDISCVIHPITVLDQPYGVMGIFTDITNEVRLEKTRREYVANVSHELKTPLTGVMSLIEPLKDGIVTDKAQIKRYYEMIFSEILRLNRLINDLLVLSRLQSSTKSFELQKVNLGDLIADRIDYYSSMLDTKIQISYKYFDKSFFVLGNADRIAQVLTILLDNAVKFSSNQNQSDIVNIKIDVEQDEKKYIVSVCDFGAGISKSDLPFVFDRFYKSDKARNSPGTGLGLSIAKETLQRMNESIWVESDGANGTTFYFTLTKYI